MSRLRYAVGYGGRIRLQIFFVLFVASWCHPCSGLDGGELHRWGDSAQGWWLSPGSFNTAKAHDPLTGADGTVNSAGILASTNGVYALRFNGTSTYIDIPSQPRFNFSSQFDTATLLCTGPVFGGVQGMCSYGNWVYWVMGSSLSNPVMNVISVGATTGTIVNTFTLAGAGHGNDVAWWGAADNPMGTDALVVASGNVSGTNGILATYNTNGVALSRWDIGAVSSLTNIDGAAHIASNQFFVCQADLTSTYSTYRFATVYLGVAAAGTGTCSIAWIQTVPSLGKYMQGSAGTNGHAYVLFEVTTSSQNYLGAIYDFLVGSNSCSLAGVMMVQMPNGNNECDGLTWYQGSLIVGSYMTSTTNLLLRTQWPMFIKHGFTLSAWATKESNSGNLNLITKFNAVTGGRSWIMENISGQLACYLRNTNDTEYIFQGASGGTNFPFYGWHNYTLSFDGVNLTGYTDGYLAFTNGYYDLASGVALASPTDVLIGCIVGSQFWQGFMKDVRMWNRPLSAAEVNRLYLEGP